MQWALLGTDREVEAVQRLFAATPDLELVRVSPSEWESLLVRNQYDAVFVTRGLEESLGSEIIKKLVASGVAVVVMHPAVDVLMAYEIEVIRRDNAGTIIAFAPGWYHPAWDRLHSLITLEQSPLGRTEHLSFERHIDDRTHENVLTQLSQDIRLVRRLLGNITSINAVGDSRSDDTWNSLTVHFVSDSGRSANWSMSAPNIAGETRVRVSGTQGTATLLISGIPGQQKWEFHHPQGTHEIFVPGDDGAKLVEELQRASADESPVPSWSETCLDLEIAEAVERSLRRKRAVDLYTTNRSEEKTFKGFMAASGCLVLTAILLAFLGLAMWDGFRAPFREPRHVGSVESPRDRDDDEWPLWVRLWPVYPLLGFLLMQLLLFIARRPNPGNASAAGKAAEIE